MPKVSTGQFSVVRVSGRMARPRHQATGSFPSLEQAEAWALECNTMFPGLNHGIIRPDNTLVMPGETEDEECTLNFPHCRSCGRDATDDDREGYSECCNKVIVNIDNCPNYHGVVHADHLPAASD